MVWKERSVSAWGGQDTEIGATIAGKLVRTDPNVNATPDNQLFDYILDSGGKEQRVWGSRFLNLQLTKGDIGKNVKIKFDGYGKAQKGKNAPKMFRVEVEE